MGIASKGMADEDRVGPICLQLPPVLVGHLQVGKYKTRFGAEGPELNEPPLSNRIALLPGPAGRRGSPCCGHALSGNSPEAQLQVGKDVSQVFDTHRKSHQSGGNAGGLLLLGGELGVGGGGRVDHQAALIADVGHMAMELESLHKRPTRFDAALDFEGQHPGAAQGRVLASELMPGTAFQAGVVDRKHLGALFEPAGNGQGIGGVPLDAQR